MTKSIYPIILPQQIVNMKGRTYYELVVAAYELGLGAGIRHASAGLKEQALALLDPEQDGQVLTAKDADLIRRALEALPND